MAVPTISVPEAWRKAGIDSGYERIPFDRLFRFTAGVPKVGKTTLESGNPHGLIIDADHKAPSVIGSVCQFFPAKVKEPLVRQPIDETSYMEVHKFLVAHAKDPDNPIHTVVFDSWDEFRERVTRPMLEKEYLKKGWIQNMESCFDYGGRPGDRKGTGGGFTQLADLEIILLGELRKAGYGISILSHLTRESGKIGDKVETRAQAPLIVTTTESSMKKLRPKVSIYARLLNEKVKNPQGQYVAGSRMSFVDRNPAECDLGCNVRMPDTLDFWSDDPVTNWNLYLDTYNKYNP